MLNNLREQLGATDEEWQVLSPKIEKVMNAQREARFAGMGFGFGRRGGGMGGPDSQSVVGRAAAELRELLQNPDVTPDAINAKLAALREARAKAQADLAAAQKELKELLTPRQEATLVLFGMLE
jgi:Spy/CpxP family protein refolding chaperone